MSIFNKNKDEIKIVVLFSVSRTGSNYLGNILRMFPFISVHSEIFHFQEAFSITPEISESLNQKYKIDDRCGEIKSIDPKLINWLRSHPKETITELSNLAIKKNSKIIYLKIFNGHLIDEEQGLHTLANIKELIPVILQRRSVDVFISFIKARLVNSYTGVDTTGLQPNVTMEQYKNWADPRRLWYSNVINIMKKNNKNIHYVTYEDDINIEKNDCLLKWINLFMKWGCIDNTEIGGYLKNIKKRSVLQRQDQSYLKQKISNWNHLFDEISNAGLEDEFMGYLHPFGK